MITIPSHCLAPTIRRSFVYIWSVFIIISQRAATVTSPAWLAYGLPIFYLFIYFLFRNWSQPLLIRSPKFLLPTHVSWLRVVNVGLEFRKSYLLISHGAKKPPKKPFSRVFHCRPHVFDLRAKTGCARRNPKTNVSSTMNYLSSDITLITVVLVVL